jgi:predicted O-methyltransferase YrrM
MPEFATLLNDAKHQFSGLTIESADLFAKKALVQYAAVRAVAPPCVVETGIANGVSSLYLLLALHKNGGGCLHSIGLDDPAFLPPGKRPGWLVPDWLRRRWHTHIGDSREILPALLAQLRSIDVFVHDSLHTYDHMMWEFNAAYAFVRPGGLIFSDDALWNNAFHDFARKFNEPDARIIRGVGFLRKTAK